MSREVRLVPKGWEHPKDANGHYIPLMAEPWDDEDDEGNITPADPSTYMPPLSLDEVAYYMMYQTVSEGTPISPAFSTPEELAHWLADTGANAGAGETASYEAWLRVAKGGFAPSAIGIGYAGCGMLNGVEGMYQLETARAKGGA